MIRALATPHYGQTHVKFTLFHNEPGRVFTRGTYGTVDAAGAFVPATDLVPMEREITGKNYVDFFTTHNALWNQLTDALMVELGL